MSKVTGVNTSLIVEEIFPGMDSDRVDSGSSVTEKRENYNLPHQ